MIVPETSLLIYAVNRGASFHQRANSWLNSALVGDESVGFVWSTLTEFVRLTTRSSLPAPLTVEEAFEIVNRWITARNARIIHPGPRHRELLQKLITAVGIGSNMVSNAHLAAIAIEHGAEVCSNDSQFNQFPGLRWRNPLAD